MYSMVAAVSPGKMLAAALVAASFDPLGVWLAHLRGVPTPSLLGTLRHFLAQLRVLPDWRLFRRVFCATSDTS